jgi:hypothetical protein
LYLVSIDQKEQCVSSSYEDHKKMAEWAHCKLVALMATRRTLVANHPAHAEASKLLEYMRSELGLNIPPPCEK